MRPSNVASVRVKAWTLLKRLFTRRNVVSLTVELYPSFINEDGKRMYKVGYRSYVEEEDMLKAFDKAVDDGLFTYCEVVWKHGD